MKKGEWKFHQWSHRSNNYSFPPDLKNAFQLVWFGLVGIPDKIRSCFWWPWRWRTWRCGGERKGNWRHQWRSWLGGTIWDLPLVTAPPPTHLLTSLNSCCAVQFGNCPRPDILKPNLISTSFCHAFPLHTAHIYQENGGYNIVPHPHIWYQTLQFQRISWYPTNWARRCKVHQKPSFRLDLADPRVVGLVVRSGGGPRSSAANLAEDCGRSRHAAL